MDKEKFEKFDRENPEIFKEFERRTMLLINRGKKWGAAAILGAMEFHAALTNPNGDAVCKINKAYAPGYARKFLELHPECKGCFRTRKARNA